MVRLNRWILICVTLFFGLTVFAESTQTIWQIGESDNSTDEFALGNGKWNQFNSQFPQDCFFVVDQSSSQEDFAYVLPGPADAWAGSKSHTFTIIFAIESTEGNDSCHLLFDFVDTHYASPPKLKIEINGQVFERQLPKGASDDSLDGNSSAGKEHKFTIEFPANVLSTGNNHITLTNSNGSWILFDSISFQSANKIKIAGVQSEIRLLDLSTDPVLIQTDTGVLSQPVSATILNIGESTAVTLSAESGVPTEATLSAGIQTVQLIVPEAKSQQSKKIIIAKGGKAVAQRSVTLKPVRKWEIHLIHQTHLDIGYTHPQEEVLKLQVDYLRKALDYIDKSKDYPEESQFKWHPEGMWAVDEFMRTATDAEKEKLVEAARKKLIHIDALYAQAMSGVYSEEELFELIGSARRFSQKYNVPLTSATQSDVPGYTWGLASALAHNGVKYLSVGPNPAHRLGHLYDWADKPFYWLTPSGNNKVLFWMCAKGYGWFHGTPVGHRINPDKLFGYLDSLEKEGFPYDMIMVRYCIGADNGPPNPALPDYVKEWNEKYAYPKLIIGRNSEFLETFEKRYGDQIPVMSGDFTPFWEDGVASTSADTGINRRACEKIVQAQILWSMLIPDAKLHDQFDAAWEKLIMYDEHTWGAWNSISDPDSDFAVRQAEYKRKFALDGAAMTETLLSQAVSEYSKAGSNVVDVYNTCSWPRTEVVLLSAVQSTSGDSVEDNKGKPVPTQRLASGELAFLAEDVPAFGAKRYSVRKGKASSRGTVSIKGLTLSNDKITVEINDKTGAIKSLVYKVNGKQFVDTSKGTGLNDYLYIIGRDGTRGHERVKGPVTVTVEDAGGLVGTLRIDSDAPGCRKLTRTVRIVDGSETVELVNTTDKLKERRQEGVYFEYPLNIPDGISKIDIPWAVCQPEKDQLPGANRNYYCVQRWVDISNNDYGLTWVTVDAPMLQFDPIILPTIGWPSLPHEWRTKIEPGRHFYSWVMNNHWETNYKADQEGLITFKYVLKPHAGEYDPVKAQQFGRSVHQPLVAVCSDPDKPVAKSMFTLDNDGVVVTSVKPSRDGQGLMIRLFNTTDSRTNVSVDFPQAPKAVWLSNPMEDRISQVNGAIEMTKNEIVTLRLERQKAKPL